MVKLQFAYFHISMYFWVFILQQIESLDSKILKLENEMGSLHTIHDEQNSELNSLKQAEALLQLKLTETQQKVKQYERDLQLKDSEHQVGTLIHVYRL